MSAHTGTIRFGGDGDDLDLEAIRTRVEQAGRTWLFNLRREMVEEPSFGPMARYVPSPLITIEVTADGVTVLRLEDGRNAEFTSPQLESWCEAIEDRRRLLVEVERLRDELPTRTLHEQ